MLVDDDVADGHELVVEAARGLRVGPAALRPESESVLVLARDAETHGDVLGCLAHRLEREPLLEPRVRKPPAELGVVGDDVAARPRPVALHHRERRAAHRLDAAGDEEVALPRSDRPARFDDGREAGGAEPVDGDAGNGLRQPGEQQRHARDVPVVLAGLVRAADEDVLDLARRHAGSVDRGTDGEGGEIVGPRPGERAAVTADRRPHGREDHGARRRYAVTAHLSSPLLVHPPPPCSG